jgi:tetratricopeptide (TPR) repeat protein
VGIILLGTSVSYFHMPSPCQALRIAPNSTEAYYNRGVARTEVGNLRGAIADYTQAIRLNPTLAEAYNNRGVMRYRLGDSKDAIADLQQAAQLFRDQGNMASYRQTLNFIRMIQQSLTPQSACWSSHGALVGT